MAMMGRKCIQGLGVALPLAVAMAVLCAGEVWSNKDYTKWSAEDVNRLLTNSPWATQVSASFDTAPRDVKAAVIPPPGASTANMGGTRGVTDGRWDGGIGKNVDNSPPKLPVTVRWDSALPVRQALLRSRLSDRPGPGDPQETLNQPEKDYIVTVIGLLTSDQSIGRERMSKELMYATRLVRTGKPPIRPEAVKLDASISAIQIFFPRTDPITVGEKDVIFELQFGAISVERKFRLKTMTYKGKLEL